MQALQQALVGARRACRAEVGRLARDLLRFPTRLEQGELVGEHVELELLVPQEPGDALDLRIALLPPPAVRARRPLVQRLIDHDWRQSFTELDEKLAPAIRERARKASEETERAIDQTIDRWFGSDASLQTLVHDELVPALRRYQESLVEFVQGSLDEEVMSGTAGILLPTDVSADIYASGLDLGVIGRECLDRVDRNTLLKPVATPLGPNQVPVRRGVLDWVMLRSPAKLRARLFGDNQNPAARISIEVKDKKIGKEGREAIRRELDLYKGRFFHETVQHVHRHLVGQYVDHSVASMKDVLKERDVVLDKQLDEIVAELMEHRKVLAHLSTLKGGLEQASASVEELAAEYGRTEPSMLIQPLPAPQGSEHKQQPTGLDVQPGEQAPLQPNSEADAQVS